MYEVYELAILTATILSTALSLTASGEFVVIFHAFAFLAALLALLALLAGLLTALLTALLATASWCLLTLLTEALILAAGTHVSLLLIVLLHSVVCHFLPPIVRRVIAGLKLFNMRASWRRQCKCPCIAKCCSKKELSNDTPGNEIVHTRAIIRRKK